VGVIAEAVRVTPTGEPVLDGAEGVTSAVRTGVVAGVGTTP
jgi:hypothetical protein